MITAIVTNFNYGRYISRCIDSALSYGLRVRVYDDGSTDGSLATLAAYGDRITVVSRAESSGNPVWGSNEGMADCDTSHLLFLDADNYLISEPPQLEVDYVFAPIQTVTEDCQLQRMWKFPTFSTDPVQAYADFQASEPPQMPFPWGGVWRTCFLNGKQDGVRKRWRDWETTQFAADFRTAIDWAKHSPSLAYHPTAFLAFRQHAKQWSAHPDREVMYAEARLAQSEPFSLLD